MLRYFFRSHDGVLVVDDQGEILGDTGRPRSKLFGSWVL